MDIEGTTTEVEGAKPTEPKEQPTYKTEEDFQRAVSKGLEATTRQLSLQQAEAKATKAKLEAVEATQKRWEEERQSLQTEIDRLVDERFADDPDSLRGYKSVRALDEREKKARARDAELELKSAELDGMAWAIEMHKVADEIQKENPSIPRSVLEACSSEKQMKDLAAAFPKKAEEAEVREPKFATQISSGGLLLHPTVEQLDKLTPEQYAEYWRKRREV